VAGKQRAFRGRGRPRHTRLFLRPAGALSFSARDPRLAPWAVFCAASRLSCFPFYPRLTPWATFSRRFAAGQGAEKVQTRTSGLKPSIKYGLTAALKALRHPNSEFRSTLRSHGLPLLGILSPLWGFLIFRSHPRLAPWAVILRRSAAGQGAEEVQRRHSAGVLCLDQNILAPRWSFLICSRPCAVGCILAPLRGFLVFPFTHGLHRGLHSHASSRLAGRVLECSATFRDLLAIVAARFEPLYTIQANIT